MVPSHRPVGFADGPAHLPRDWIIELDTPRRASRLQ
jgi:hypothetical protein